MADKIIIAGGSGFIGKRLISLLNSKGFNEIVILSRNNVSHNNIKTVIWDGRNQGEWQKELEGAKAIINLSGKSVNTRFTPENKREILDSRLYSTKAIGKAIENCQIPPEIWIQAGAIGFYGNSGSLLKSEDSDPGTGFLADLCINWEAIFNASKCSSTRKVLFRIGFVLDNLEGGLPLLTKITKYFLGGKIGDGMNYISWIHIDDLLNIILFALENNNLQGIFNAVSSKPLTNEDLMNKLRKALRRPWCPPAPLFMVKLVSKFTGVPAELILNSNNISNKKLLESGFTFKYQTMDEAIDKIFNP